MQAIAGYTSSLAGRLAEDLLRAWIAGDTARVHTELESSISIPVEDCDSAEEERRHLLKAVAGRMWACSDRLDAHNQSPDLELCMNLLGHLVSLRPLSVLQPN
jgi:hypothetical protein